VGNFEAYTPPTEVTEVTYRQARKKADDQRREAEALQAEQEEQQREEAHRSKQVAAQRVRDLLGELVETDFSLEPIELVTALYRRPILKHRADRDSMLRANVTKLKAPAFSYSVSNVTGGYVWVRSTEAGLVIPGKPKVARDGIMLLDGRVGLQAQNIKFAESLHSFAARNCVGAWNNSVQPLEAMSDRFIAHAGEHLQDLLADHRPAEVIA